jgi:hypothetical protein
MAAYSLLVLALVTARTHISVAASPRKQSELATASAFGGGGNWCHVTRNGCRYVVKLVPENDQGEHGTSCGAGALAPNVTTSSAVTSRRTAHVDDVTRRLDAMDEKLSRMLKDLSVRSLRQLRQIKKDLHKISTSIKDTMTAAGSATGQLPAIATGSVSSLVPCLPEFQRVGAWPSCYRFSMFNATWHEAREYCSAFGANLLALDSLKEAHIIDYLLNSKPEYQARDSWWTSGNYMVRNQRWMWTSKHHLKPITYSRWAARDDDDDGDDTVDDSVDDLMMQLGEATTVSSAPNMHCLILSKPQKYYWQEANCTDKHSFICEVDDA